MLTSFCGNTVLKDIVVNLQARKVSQSLAICYKSTFNIICILGQAFCGPPSVYEYLSKYSKRHEKYLHSWISIQFLKLLHFTKFNTTMCRCHY